MQKQTIVLVIVLLAVVIVGLALLFASRKESSEQLEALESISPSLSVNPSVSVKKTTPSSLSSSAGIASYSDSIKLYEGRRIQFDANCQATPNSVTFKNGTKIMIDNRSPQDRRISIGGTTYVLKPFGYQFITLKSDRLPKTFVINCGAQVNIGSILLQQ